MKILMVVTLFYPYIGGTSRDYYEICDNLPAGEISVLTQRRVAWTSNDIKGWKEFDEKQKFKIYRVKRLRSRIIKEGGRPNLFVSIFRFAFCDLPLMAYVLFTFSRVLMRERPDVVCFENPDYLGWLSMVNKYVFRRKTVFFLHGEELTSYAGGRVFEKPRFFYLSKADKLIIFSSEFTKKVLKQYELDEKAVLIRPGLSLDRRVDEGFKNSLVSKYVLSGKKVLLSISRLEEHKGIGNIIRAMPLVLEKVPGLVYLIGGSGSEEESLKRSAQELGLEDTIRFVGQIREEEMAAYYDLCDIFVLANIQTKEGVVDGYGVVFIEAGSMGKPVIGGRVGGVPEAVIGGETGILVDGTNKEEIAGAIIKLLEDPELARKLGENGKRRAEQFGWDKITREFRQKCLD